MYPTETAEERLLLDLDSVDLAAVLNRVARAADDAGVSHSLVHLFDERAIDRPAQARAIEGAVSSGRLSFAYLADFRAPGCRERVERAAALGLRAVTFHPYLQRIESSEYARVSEIALAAGARGLIVAINAAYGSRMIYRVRPLELAVALLEAGAGPVVLLHGGGAKVLEALLIAEAYPGVYLETSFSLSYWLGSRVEADFAFALSKLGPERCLFGSDAPFCDRGAAVADHLRFFERHGFDARAIERIMGGTAAGLLRL
ncbi:MAG: amidohydrolase family protein [Alphaproteobacteria bacterium]